ncbi:hypothetical protein [Runella sp.]|uniref:hypothetical protein n=1 Tax=Runella sp. TaxID=1960881 RepID=UPI003D14601F
MENLPNFFSILATAMDSLFKREAFLNWLMKEKPELVQELLKEYEQQLKSKQIAEPQNQLKQ